MNKYEVRLECLRTAIREMFKDPDALRAKVDLYYDIVSDGDELPKDSPKVQVINEFPRPPHIALDKVESDGSVSVSVTKESGNSEKPQAKAGKGS